ncbi:hypothetical protein BD413DRAFT_600514 [Trametes elegans]|nr:hypothetical protein BD413DRAFT_600514 [Trametes elegans]
MDHHFAFALHDLPAAPSSSRHTGPILLPPPPSMFAHRSTQYPNQYWRSQAPQFSLFSGPLAPSSWTNAGSPNLPSLWPSGPPDFLLPYHRYPAKSYDAQPAYPVARSDTSSAISRDSDLSPAPTVAEVVCNAPLVAPVPLPYHSPTFLMYDLPDEDEDLSHPPYTHRPHKRKRARDESDADEGEDACEGSREPAKRRARWAAGASASASAGQWAGAAARHPPAAGFLRRSRAR